MRFLNMTFAMSMLCAAGPALATSDGSQTCATRMPEVTKAWEAAKSELGEAEELSLQTTEGSVDVSVGDAQPTENWFGKPPSPEVVDEYLVAAKEAMDAGDEEACQEQLTNVEEAMSTVSKSSEAGENGTD